MRYFTPSKKSRALFDMVFHNLRAQGQTHGVSKLAEHYTIRYNDVMYTILPTDRVKCDRYTLANFSVEMDVCYPDGSMVDDEDINPDILYVMTLLTGRTNWVINGELWVVKSRRERLFTHINDAGSFLVFAVGILALLNMKDK